MNFYPVKMFLFKILLNIVLFAGISTFLKSL